MSRDGVRDLGEPKIELHYPEDRLSLIVTLSRHQDEIRELEIQVDDTHIVDVPDQLVTISDLLVGYGSMEQRLTPLSTVKFITGVLSVYGFLLLMVTRRLVDSEILEAIGLLNAQDIQINRDVVHALMLLYDQVGPSEISATLYRDVKDFILVFKRKLIRNTQIDLGPVYLEAQRRMIAKIKVEGGDQIETRLARIERSIGLSKK